MRLGVLYDPANPLTPVRAVVDQLRTRLELVDLTFAQLSHRTLPNAAQPIQPLIDHHHLDALLWVEGGPLPKDLHDCAIRKVAWFLNDHLEPTLFDDLAPLFDLVCTSTKASAVGASRRWLPLAATGERLRFPAGIHLMAQDPVPPSQLDLVRTLDSISSALKPTYPIVLCPGSRGNPHPALFDVLHTGIAAIVGPETDLRDVAWPEEHLFQYKHLNDLPELLQDLCNDSSRSGRVAARAPEIVAHLHSARARAEQLQELIFPTMEVLGGAGHQPKISVLTYCYKYLRRFSFYLESLARQDLPPGSLEIVIVDPSSPDGLANYLREFAQKHPHLRVIRQPIGRQFHRNRGVCINRAFDLSCGQAIISTDGDILFPPGLIGELAAHVGAHPDRVFGVRRCFLSQRVTKEVLEGRTDPFRHMDMLLRNSGDGEPEAREGILGYCQAVHRDKFAIARYPEEFDRVNQSDIIFLERLQKYAGVQPQFWAERSVLHLWHPRNWAGTTEPL